MMYLDTITLWTKTYNEFTVITPQVKEILAKSGIQNGMLTVVTRHTTTGITVNEALECLESDIAVFLDRLIPEDYPYSHARMLRDYGSTAGNATGHLKAHITAIIVISRSSTGRWQLAEHRRFIFVNLTDRRIE